MEMQQVILLGMLPLVLCNSKSVSSIIILSESRGCESNLQEVLYVQPDICKSDGDDEGCYEGVFENPVTNEFSDLEWRVCCCKGDL